MPRSSKLWRACRAGTFTACTLAAMHAASAYSLWSTSVDPPGTGEISLSNETSTLGELKFHRLLLVGPSGWMVPFNNTGESAPNGCTQFKATPGAKSGQSGMRVNRNIESCPTILTRGEFSMFVIDGGRHQGHQLATISPAGVLSMSADVALQLGNSAPMRAPFYATTGVVKLPSELRSRVEEIVRRMPWMKAAAGELRGRLGDFNGNGWVDGTFIATGTLPANAAGVAGAPYVLIRHFETDLPANGVLSGNVKALARGNLR